MADILEHKSVLVTVTWGDGKDEAVTLAVDAHEFGSGADGFRYHGPVVMGSRSMLTTIQCYDPKTRDPALIEARREVAEAKELGKARLYGKMAIDALAMAGALKKQGE